MVIAQVDPGSIAGECGISPGDVLLSVNGRELRDYIDYMYELASEDVILAVRKKDGSL